MPLASGMNSPGLMHDMSPEVLASVSLRRCDWEEVKEDVMYVALYAKFTQHEHLRKLLLGMGDCKLVEHTGQDTYWGDGGDGSGQNKLGKLLMKLREELKKEIEAAPVSQGGRKRRAAVQGKEEQLLGCVGQWE